MASKGKLGTNEKRDKWRDSIKTTKILQRLQNQILGQDTKAGNTVLPPMTATDVNIARILLNRTLPELKSIEYSGESGPISIEIVKFDENTE